MTQSHAREVTEELRSEIGAYLSRFCDGVLDPRLGEFLGLSVGRILLKEARFGRDWKSAATDEQLRHIADWLKASIVNDDVWLSNVDAHGRPKKLMKFGSIDQIMQEADKAMLKAAQRLSGVKLVEGDEELYAELEDGYYVVRLLTPAALDCESAQMQHCIGDGAYDDCVLDSRYLYISLRDKAGNAHATLEVIDNEIVHFQGKQNKKPRRVYADQLKPFIQRRGFTCKSTVKLLGYVVDTNGKWHHIDELPNNISVGEHLDLHNIKISKLPVGLCVKGSLILYGTGIKSLPDYLRVDGNLDLRSIYLTSLPTGLRVGGDINLYGSCLTTLPSDIFVGGEMDLRMSVLLESLPDGLVVGGDLLLGGSGLKYLPNEIIIGGNLNLANSDIKYLPKGLSIGGSLYLGHSSVQRLPEGLSVGGDLFLTSSVINSLPNDLVVGGDIYLDGIMITSIPDGVSVGGEIFSGALSQLSSPQESY